MSNDDTHYDLLGVEPTASKNDVRAAYQRALGEAQSAGRADDEAAIRRAWQVLSDPMQRQRYDEAIGVGLRAAPAPRAGTETTDDEDDDDEDDDDDEVVDADSIEVEDELAPGPPQPGAHLPVGAPSFLEQPTLGRRLVASLIDGFTLLAVMAAGIAIAFSATNSNSGRSIAVVALFEIFVVGLFVVPTGRTGQTFGKRVTYIMTVERSTGELLSPLGAVSRYALPMVAVPALGQLGPFLALFYGLSYAMGRDQLSLADRLGRSIVVVARYRPTRAGHVPSPAP